MWPRKGATQALVQPVSPDDGQQRGCGAPETLGPQGEEGAFSSPPSQVHRKRIPHPRSDPANARSCPGYPGRPPPFACWSMRDGAAPAAWGGRGTSAWAVAAPSLCRVPTQHTPNPDPRSGSAETRVRTHTHTPSLGLGVRGALSSVSLVLPVSLGSRSKSVLGAVVPCALGPGAGPRAPGQPADQDHAAPHQGGLSPRREILLRRRSKSVWTIKPSHEDVNASHTAHAEPHVSVGATDRIWGSAHPPASLKI